MEVFLVGLVAATLRMATPLILGTLGELFCERSGVLNLGIEGTMFLGAFTGFLIAYTSGSIWLGLLCAILSGVIAGLLMALLSVTLGANQHVSGLGITLLLTGLSLYANGLFLGTHNVQPSIEPFAKISPLAAIPILGQILDQYPLTYAAFLLIPLTMFILNRTPFGQAIRAVGENPEAADAAGLPVHNVRYAALAIGGGLMAAGGAFLSLAQLGSFTFGIVAGRGWVCIALIILANWRPAGVLWGSLLFGGVSALQLRLQSTGMDLPYELFLALPYLVTILALALTGRSNTVPAALLKAYRRE